MVRTVSQVLTELEGATGHRWRVEDTGGGCEVFYSETLNAVLGIDGSINYDRDGGGVFDTVADLLNWEFRREIVEGLEDSFTVDTVNGPDWALTVSGEGVNIWEDDTVTYSAVRLGDVIAYLAGVNA